MDEFKFVLKCFLFSCLLLTFTQLKMNGLTVEARIQNSLLNTTVADFLNQTAAGGVKLIKNISESMQQTVHRWMNSSNQGESFNQIVRNPSAKKAIDNSGLDLNDEISSKADFENDVE